ncbi:MAG: hypothetical protein ACYDEX_16405 [Mobilitalea sp.]
MSRKDLFQTVTFRLNINHEPDALIWHDLKSVDREPRKSIFGDKSKYIKHVLGRVAKDEYDMEENDKKLVEIKENFMLSCQKELIEAVSNECEKIMASVEKNVELAVCKAVADILKAVLAGGVSISAPVNMISEQSDHKISTEKSLPKMGALPEVDENSAFPSTAMNFLDGF